MRITENRKLKEINEFISFEDMDRIMKYDLYELISFLKSKNMKNFTFYFKDIPTGKYTISDYFYDYYELESYDYDTYTIDGGYGNDILDYLDISFYIHVTFVDDLMYLRIGHYDNDEKESMYIYDKTDGKEIYCELKLDLVNETISDLDSYDYTIDDCLDVTCELLLDSPSLEYEIKN